VHRHCRDQQERRQRTRGEDRHHAQHYAETTGHEHDARRDDLQELGFVDRRLEEASPVATYYSLTEKGESLCPVFDAIEAWADEWLEVDADAIADD
jgi:hypothetical protein